MKDTAQLIMASCLTKIEAGKVDGTPSLLVQLKKERKEKKKIERKENFLLVVMSPFAMFPSLRMYRQRGRLPAE